LEFSFNKKVCSWKGTVFLFFGRFQHFGLVADMGKGRKEGRRREMEEPASQMKDTHLPN
jgi:hypothetical protein